MTSPHAAPASRRQPSTARRLHALGAMALLAAAAATGAGAARADGNATAGRLLYEDTVNQVSNVFNRCIDCHFTRSNPALDRVADRRTVLGGSEFAVISESTARSRIGAALNIQEMVQFRSALSSQDLDDLAAYIADVPKVVDLNGTVITARQTFAAASVGANVFETFTLRHSQATAATLVVNSVTVTAGTNFLVTGGSCGGANVGTPLQPGGQCTVQIGYTAQDSARQNATVSLSLTQQGVTFTRAIAVTGEVQGVTAPGGSTNPNPSGGEGGGSLGFAWLAALAAAVAAVARRRERAGLTLGALP
jgi:trimeric autotransporter adhesin